MNRKTQRTKGSGERQPPSPTTIPTATPCNVISVGKRRDGGTRYWCLLHKADATAKYGRPAKNCRYSHVPLIKPEDAFTLDIDHYPGGVALWGAVPPVYDTTTLSIDRGIHVHAREKPRCPKSIDHTYRAVRLVGKSAPPNGLLISELDAIYYMVSTVFGYGMRHVVCTYCSYSHLDKDWFSLHAHRRHLCAGCGKHFRDTDIGIGNPICNVRNALGLQDHPVAKTQRKLNILQSAYPGGLQIWGSNPAFLWTGTQDEEEGIHVHAFGADGSHPLVDDTFCEVIIDGVSLDPGMVRTLMAQSTLPHIAKRVVPLTCHYCGRPHLSGREGAFTPAATHTCAGCQRQFTSKGRLRKVISNPLIAILEALSVGAPRRPQHHELGLLPETI
jgi:transposase-like protein